MCADHCVPLLAQRSQCWSSLLHYSYRANSENLKNIFIFFKAKSLTLVCADHPWLWSAPLRNAELFPQPPELCGAAHREAWPWTVGTCPLCHTAPPGLTKSHRHDVICSWHQMLTLFLFLFIFHLDKLASAPLENNTHINLHSIMDNSTKQINQITVFYVQ